MPPRSSRSQRARPGDPLLAVAYLRVSTEDQRLGPEAQRAQIEAWAARQKVQVATWHTDQGVSGSAEVVDRPALGAALADLRATGAGLLLVAKRDRLARDVQVAAAIEKAAASSGARVQSADGVGNGDGDSDQFMRTIIDATAAYERALIRTRTRAALAAKRARGERTGELPFGLRLGQGKLLEPNPPEQQILALVLALRAEGRSLRGIVTELASSGLLGRAGRPLSKGSIENLLRRPAQAKAS